MMEVNVIPKQPYLNEPDTASSQAASLEEKIVDLKNKKAYFEKHFSKYFAEVSNG